MSFSSLSSCCERVCSVGKLSRVGFVPLEQSIAVYLCHWFGVNQTLGDTRSMSSHGALSHYLSLRKLIFSSFYLSPVSYISSVSKLCREGCFILTVYNLNNTYITLTTFVSVLQLIAVVTAHWSQALWSCPRLLCHDGLQKGQRSMF